MTTSSIEAIYERGVLRLYAAHTKKWIACQNRLR